MGLVKFMLPPKAVAKGNPPSGAIHYYNVILRCFSESLAANPLGAIAAMRQAIRPRQKAFLPSMSFMACVSRLKSSGNTSPMLPILNVSACDILPGYITNPLSLSFV